MRRRAWLAGTLLWVACGDSAPAPAPPPATPPAEAPRETRPGPPFARFDVVDGLELDRDAPRHASDGGGRAWFEFPEGGGGPFVAGRSARFPLVYEAGPLGIAEGGRILFQVSPFWGWSTPQVEEPAAPGYTRVATDATGVTLAAATVDEQLLSIGITGRALAPGERVEIVYGVGPAGARVDRYAERASVFWVGVDGDGDGVRAWIEAPPAVEVVAGSPARLVLVLPATARPGETVLLRASLLDRLNNSGVAFEGELELVASREGLELPSRLVFPADARGRAQLSVVAREPGVYWIEARGPDGLIGESNPLFVDATSPRILFGDLHGHSALSDGTGTPEDYFLYARDVAGLDVAALTDHDHWGIPFLDASPALWREIEATTRRFHEPGRFVTILGWEWTSWIWGHRHVLHFEDSASIRSSFDPASDEPAELWAALRGLPALTFAHHSAGGAMPTDWSIPPDPVLEPVTEIVSAHGSSEALDSPGLIYSPLPGNFVRDALGRGYRLGFVGSGDGHDGHPGLTHLGAPSGGVAAIFAEERTREAVLEALRARRVYATNGPRMVLNVALDGRPMGSLVPPGRYTLAIRVAAPRPLERADLVLNGQVAERLPLGERRELALEFPDAELRPGDSLYVRVVQQDGGAAWSSPFFVEAPAAR